MTQVSLVLPAYNEAEGLKDTVAQVADALQKITPTFEIIIAEDGSSDGTDKIAEALAKAYPYIKHLHSNDRLGRGKALNRAFKLSKGEILAYIDVDLATDLKHLEELINAIKEEGYDFSTGSRMLKESDVERSVTRLITSKGFNLVTRLLLKSELKDHQCGFKAFKRGSLFDLLDDVKDNHWFWDTELLVRAQRKGYKVKEFPVRWRSGRNTKVDLKLDILEMGAQIIRLRKELKNE
ncbi:MAG TPA: glycosyltransferase family 2 protein [Methanophagales archaeon]|nr:glycosyltransferase family 2 protein [Methanophagales archaeon]